MRSASRRAPALWLRLAAAAGRDGPARLLRSRSRRWTPPIRPKPAAPAAPTQVPPLTPPRAPPRAPPDAPEFTSADALHPSVLSARVQEAPGHGRSDDGGESSGFLGLEPRGLSTKERKERHLEHRKKRVKAKIGGAPLRLPPFMRLPQLAEALGLNAVLMAKEHLRRERKTYFLRGADGREYAFSSRKRIILDWETAAAIASRCGFTIAEQPLDLLHVPRSDALRAAADLGLNRVLKALDVREHGVAKEQRVKKKKKARKTGDARGEARRADDSGGRTPVIALLGHADAGKTTLLECMLGVQGDSGDTPRTPARPARSTKGDEDGAEDGGEAVEGRRPQLSRSEPGLMTQELRLASVGLDGGGAATVVDTPGQAVFWRMRGAGGELADAAILAVSPLGGAALPETAEAIGILEELRIPFAVAVTHADEHGAGDARVAGTFEELRSFELLDSLEERPRAAGAAPLAFRTCGRSGDGVGALLSHVARLGELASAGRDVAQPAGASCTCSIVDFQLDQGRGQSLRLIVRRGTLRAGDHFLAGFLTGYVRKLIPCGAAAGAPSHTDAALPGDAVVALIKNTGSTVDAPIGQDLFVLSQSRARALREQKIMQLELLDAAEELAAPVPDDTPEDAGLTEVVEEAEDGRDDGGAAGRPLSLAELERQHMEARRMLAAERAENSTLLHRFLEDGGVGDVSSAPRVVVKAPSGHVLAAVLDAAQDIFPCVEDVVIGTGIGGATLSDVRMAKSSGALLATVCGARLDGAIRRQCRQLGVAHRAFDTVPELVHFLLHTEGDAQPERDLADAPLDTDVPRFDGAAREGLAKALMRDRRGDEVGRRRSHRRDQRRRLIEEAEHYMDRRDNAEAAPPPAAARGRRQRAAETLSAPTPFRFSSVEKKARQKAEAKERKKRRQRLKKQRKRERRAAAAP